MYLIYNHTTHSTSTFPRFESVITQTLKHANLSDISGTGLNALLTTIHSRHLTINTKISILNDLLKSSDYSIVNLDK